MVVCPEEASKPALALVGDIVVPNASFCTEATYDPATKLGSRAQSHSALHRTDRSMFVITEVPPGPPDSIENLGAKFKFWYHAVDHGLTLFKEGRPGTGENWAEKVACELAECIRLPHALYELARYNEKQGVVCRTLVARGARIIHANELLSTSVQDYELRSKSNYRESQHTLRRVLGYFKLSESLQLTAPYGYERTPEISSATDFFIGYLMFDAWIGNQDRHDNNWGVIRSNDGSVFLAPSYDHGSSLARNESDEIRRLMLTTKDRGRHISSYIARARSALYPHHKLDEKVKALFTLEAFIGAAEKNQLAAEEWCKRLIGVAQLDIVRILDQVPPAIMSEVAKEFTLKFLLLNQVRIYSAVFKK